MLVSYECPVSLLEGVQKYTDYEYCLAHLFLTNASYRKFFIEKARKEHLILDNGCYEMKEPLKPEDLIKIAETLKPEYLVAPDYLGDSGKTIESFKEFKSLYKGKIAGVAHHKDNLQDFFETLSFMFQEADLVMIPFLNFKSGLERKEAIFKAVEKGYWDYSKPVHLLGCRELVEFKGYSKLSNIKSIDTSNPIKYAVAKGLYPRELVDYRKVPFSWSFEDESLKLSSEMISNMKRFKEELF